MAEPVEYAVGDVVVYETIMSRLRRARVIERHEDMEDTGEPGFDAVEEPGGNLVWGYDRQIVEVDPA